MVVETGNRHGRLREGRRRFSFREEVWDVWERSWLNRADRKSYAASTNHIDVRRAIYPSSSDLFTAQAKLAAKVFLFLAFLVQSFIPYPCPIYTRESTKLSASSCRPSLHLVCAG
jgi:hypothetical protein